MNIAIISHTMYPIRKPFFGGLEMHTHILAEQLIARGHNVSLFAAKGSDPQLNVIEISEPGYYHKSRRWKRLLYDNKHFIRNARSDHGYGEKLFAAINSNFDVIHNNSLSALPIEYVNTLKKPTLTTLHVPPIDELKSVVARSEGNPLHKIVTVSHNNAFLWSNSVGFKPDVIHNGVDLNKWRYKTYTPDHKFAVWYGRITPEKGLTYAIDACKKADIDLKIIGPIADESYYEKEIQPKLDDRIMYYGHLSHEIINHIVSSASVVVVSSVWEEPFGLVVAESLAMGTPVAAFRIGALPEIITPSVGELAQLHDTDDLARAITESLKKDPMLCRKTAEQRFSIDQMIDNYEAAYKTLSERKLERPVAVPSWAAETV